MCIYVMHECAGEGRKDGGREGERESLDFSLGKG